MPATVIMEAWAPSVNAQLRTVSYADAMSTGRIISAGKGRPLPYAGGYAQNVEDTVTIHSNTVIAAKEVFGVTN